MLNEIQQTNYQVPTTKEDIAKFILFGREKLSSVKSEINAIKSLGLAKEVLDQKRVEAQFLSGVVIQAQVKLGEITKRIPKAINQYKSASPPSGLAKSKEIEKMGFTKQRVAEFEQMADHPEIVKQVQNEAKATDDLPSRKEIMRQIKKTKESLKPIIEAKEKEAKEQAIDYDALGKRFKELFATLSNNNKLSLGDKDNDFLQHNIFTAIDMYIHKFETPSDKIQAGHNIIKHIKTVINDNQTKSMDRAE